MGEEIESILAAVTFLKGMALGKTSPRWGRWRGCLEPLFKRPYWGTTWIVQEIVLATDIYIVSGSRSRSFSWKILQKAIDCYVPDARDTREMEVVAQLVHIRRSFGKS
jgi:hypothetical protein